MKIEKPFHLLFLSVSPLRLFTTRASWKEKKQNLHLCFSLSAFEILLNNFLRLHPDPDGLQILKGCFSPDRKPLENMVIMFFLGGTAKRTEPTNSLSRV